MPQIIIKSSKKSERLKQLPRTIAASLAKISWPLIPDSLFLRQINHLSIALTRVCNTNCIFCPYQFIDKNQKINMPDEIFNIVIDNIKRYSIPAIMLSPDVGEPLLAPNFIRKIEAMRNAGVRTIECTTNGTLIHKIGINTILEYGPDQINISTAGFDKHMYERVYRSNNYSSMRDNVLALLKENDRRNKSKIINIWLRGDMQINELLDAPEMEIVMELANEVCVMSEVDSWNGKISQDILTGSLKIQATAPPLTSRPCRELMQITVHPDGNIHACPCRNMGQDPDLHLGNITEDDLFTAYQCLDSIFHKWEKGGIPSICRRCLMYIDPAQGILGLIRPLLRGR